MNLIVRLIFGVWLGLLLSTISLAEDKQAEGERLIRHAEQISNIRSADARSFRLKANFALLGDGVSFEEGTYTETWVSHGRWRRESVWGSFHRTEVGTGKKRWVLDSTEEIPGKAGELGSLMNVLTVHQEPIKVAAIRDQNIQGVKARCVELKEKRIGKETLCVDAQSGVLVLSNTPTMAMGKTVEYSCRYGQYEQFGDRTYPRHIECMEDGHRGIAVRVLDLSVEPSPDSASFVPPSGAEELSNCTDKLQAPSVLKAPDPEFPKDEPQPLSPEVVWLIAGADGRPRHLKVARSIGRAFDGPALAAISLWVFKPAMCDGDPVAVPLNVEVVFRKW